MKRKAKKINNKFHIKKSSNLFEEFNEKKYQKSLARSGVSEQMQDELFEEVGDIHNYFSTRDLHHATYKALLKLSKLHAANYNIKQAIFKLGPTGYPFEILCSEMLKAKGYSTRVSCMLRGMNVKHEVDVVARRQDGNIYCECKFHSRKYHKNDIKIPLYVYARYLDLKEANPDIDFKYAIFSNTQFSKDAIKYATGVGLQLFSMNYPEKNTFCDIIRKYKVYPVTVLKSLRVKDHKDLMEQGVVVVKQITREHLENLALKEPQIIKVLQEVKILTRPN